MFKTDHHPISYKLWTAVLILTLLLTLINPFSAVEVQAIEEIPAIPAVHAKSIFVMDARTGTELYAKQPDEYISTETILPLLISMVVLDEKNPDDNILITGEAQRMTTQINGDSGEVGLKDGERLAVRQLLSSVLMAQSQDAVVALSEIFESDAAFLQKIQEKISELGLAKTVITTYLSGATLTDHTTARDMSRVMQKFLENPVLAELNAQPELAFVPNNMVPEPRTIVNSNLQFNIDSDFYMAELIAGQYAPGSTELPQNNSYIGAARTNQGLFIVALGGALSSQENFEHAKTLFDWAFRHFKAVLLIQKDEVISSMPLLDGEPLELRAQRDVYHLISASVVKPDFSLNLIPLEFPDDQIEKDQLMGSAEVVVRDKVIATVDLLANQSVNLAEATTPEAPESTLDKVLAWAIRIGLVLFFLGSIILMIRTVNLMRRSKKRQAELRASRDELLKKKKQSGDRENQKVINRSNF